MKQQIRFVLVVSIMVVSILACQAVNSITDFGDSVRGSGNVVEESRPVSGITGVELATLGNLSIELGNTESLRIEAEDNLLEYFQTEVRNGQLRIDIQDDVRLVTTEPVNYYLTVTSLDSIKISSSGDIQAPDLQAEDFSIIISSSGDLQLETLNADTLAVNISSSGDLEVGGGRVQTQDVTISSSGNYMAQDLASDRADVRISSSGSATIWVQGTLRAILSSSGDVRYRGNPTVDATTTSSGNVIQIGE